jgi:hypothetical protein
MSNQHMSAIPNIAEKSFSGSLTNFAAKKLAAYAGSKFCEYAGIYSKPDYEGQLEEIIAAQKTLQEGVDKALEMLTYITNFEQKIYTQMEKNNFQQSLSFIQNVELNTDTDWTQFVNAVGNNTLATLADDPSALDALAQIFTNSYLEDLTNQSNILSGTSPTRGNPFKDLLSSKDAYVSSMSPTQGKMGSDLISLLNQSNETLVNLYYNSLNAIQCTYVIQKTALYLKYNSTNKILNNITLSEKGILNTNTFDVNNNILQDDYTNKFNTLADLVKQDVVSDGNPEIQKTALTYPGVPKGMWVQSCILYAWCGVVDASNVYLGFYDGMTLRAKGQFSDIQNESTISLGTAYNPATDCPVLTHTKKPYLECEFLGQGNLSFSKAWSGKDGHLIGGYCDSYGGSRMNSILVDNGIVVYGNPSIQTVVATSQTKNHTLHAPNAQQASINQFLQINFSNNERALFQITRGAGELINVLMGLGVCKWTSSNNTGEQPKAISGGWKGGGYSQITVTSASKEASVIIKVSGTVEGKNYTTPILSLTPV